MALVGDDVWPMLASQPEEVERAFHGIAEERALFRYAANKWSAKEVLGHVCDTERVLSYRALRFARGDATPLATFDEDLYVANSTFDARTVPSLVEEFRTVRAATLSLVSGFDADAFRCVGVARGLRFSVRALVWVMVGHVRHHLDTLRDRYGIGG